MTGPIGILGAGAWGTALAIASARAGHAVVLCGRDPAEMALLRDTRENQRLLPGAILDATILPTADPQDLRRVDLLLAAVPAQALRAALVVAGGAVPPNAPVVICAKGIERGSGLLLSDVVRAAMPGHPAAALSGPSFAVDVALGLPTAVTLAAESRSAAAAIAERLGTPLLRLYHTDDLTGVEIGGAVKNVLAIACGIAQGYGLGASAVAALTARSFAELSRFGRANGARAETLMGLSGFGDLVLTCGSPHSRNFSLGLALGRGEDLAAAGAGRLAEGVATAPILLVKARASGVSMPIVESVDAILAGRIAVAAAIDALLARPTGAEQ